TALLKPGETILGMSLAMGGHLTHGSPVNLSGKLYRVVSYGLTQKEEIDYEAAERVAMAEKPRLIVTGASAYALAIDWKRFRAIADQCGALRGAQAGVQDLPAARAGERADDGAGAGGARAAGGVRPHRLPHVPARPARQEHHRQGRRNGTGARAHHREQECHSERPAEAGGDERRAPRQPG